MLKENETYLDSINGKVAQFMATFEEISTSIINSEFVKGVVDSGSGILGFLNNVIQTLNAIPSIAGVAFGALATKDIGYYNEKHPYSDRVTSGYSVMGNHGRECARETTPATGNENGMSRHKPRGYVLAAPFERG